MPFGYIQIRTIPHFKDGKPLKETNLVNCLLLVPEFWERNGFLKQGGGKIDLFKIPGIELANDDDLPMYQVVNFSATALVVEIAILDHLESLGYQILSGPNIEAHQEAPTTRIATYLVKMPSK